MKFKVYVKDNCDFCAQVHPPEGLNVEIINIENENYTGFRPGVVPVLQYNLLNLEGPEAINGILNMAKDAQDGNYKK